MSTHGICYDNGQSGNCNSDCEQFQNGDCDVEEDIVKAEKEENNRIYVNNQTGLRMKRVKILEMIATLKEENKKIIKETYDALEAGQQWKCCDGKTRTVLSFNTSSNTRYVTHASINGDGDPMSENTTCSGFCEHYAIELVGKIEIDKIQELLG